MAHYAFINEDNIVVEVITGVDETETETLPEGFDSWEEWYADFRGQTCKRTSYNTSGGEHILDGVPFRGNFAGIGMIYDEAKDVFYSEQPYPSWVLNETLGVGSPLFPILKLILTLLFFMNGMKKTKLGMQLNETTAT